MKLFSRLSQQALRFFQKKKPSMYFTLAAFVFLVLILPLTVFFAKQQQQTRQYAAGPQADIVVNFDFRQNHMHPISPNLFGLSGATAYPQISNQVSSFLAPGGFHTLRFGSDFVGIFNNPNSATTPYTTKNWTSLDSILDVVSQQNLHPIIEIGGSPSWLQPQNQNPPLPDYCPQVGVSSAQNPPVHSNPDGSDNGPQLWGQLAAQVVAHIDQKYPNLQPDFEIWNEPNGPTFLCADTTNPNADTIRRTAYKRIFSAAAQAMKAQLAIDKQTYNNPNLVMRVGGPTLANVKKDGANWLPDFLSDPTTAPYIDFISYHHYLYGNTNDSWDATNPFPNTDPTTQLLTRTQDPTTGVEAIFQQVANYVRSGKQPKPNNTPIFITEFNTNATGSNAPGQDCCRFKPPFAPLWNGLFFTDILNSVNDTNSPYGTAQAIPQIMSYYSINTPNSFCMFGTYDAAFDCGTTNMQPYPQYYTYQLLNDPNYLNLAIGGYIATSAQSNLPGVVVTGFYNNQTQTIFIVNTSPTDYTGMSVLMQNSWLQQQGTVLTLNTSGNPPTISTQPISLVSTDGNNYTALIPTIPHYSVVALSVPNDVAPTATPTVTPTPTFTPTPTPSPTLLPSPTPTVTPTPKPLSIASDTFNRPNQTFWGTASDGHVWTGDANSNSAYSIITNVGHIATTTSTNNAILGPQLQNAEVAITGIAHNYNNTKLGALLRYIDGDNNYLAYIDGTKFVIQKKVQGSIKSLGSIQFSATGLLPYRIRFRAQGNSLFAKVWKAGTPEPVNWMLTATDTTFTSGFAGIHFYSQKGSSATFTSFALTTF